MKILPYILLLSLVCPVFADEEPNDLIKLRAKWEKSVAEEVEKMNKEVEKKNNIYLVHLGKLQKQYMKAGDLAAANAVNAEMQKVEAMKPREGTTKENPLNGKWNLSYNHGWKRTYLIKDDTATVVSDSQGYPLGDKAELQKHKDGWLLTYKLAPCTEYLFFKDGKLHLHHWMRSLDPKTDHHSNTATGTKVEDDKGQ